MQKLGRVSEFSVTKRKGGKNAIIWKMYGNVVRKQQSGAVKEEIQQDGD